MSPARRVVVAMSGGVDSSVAAALLVEQGFDVIGVTLALTGGGSRCCGVEDVEDARAVARTLRIPFYVVNLREAFRREVMQPFAESYLAGRTPIPCVTCNRRFKFHHLLRRALALGAEAVATGHYARIEPAPGGRRLRLLRGLDRRKDQSYFLFDLGQEELRRIRFPLGALDKGEVRERARKLGLATAGKPESQEICFVGEEGVAGAVERLAPGRLPGPGEIVDRQGRVLGRHPGIHHFTVGQRRGLGLSGAGRRYVVAIDAGANRIVVGGPDELLARGAELSGLRFVSGEAPAEGSELEARIRYRHPGVPARLEVGQGGRGRLHFSRPEAAVTPGQAAVLYRGDEVVGGGWIRAALA